MYISSSFCSIIRAKVVVLLVTLMGSVILSSCSNDDSTLLPESKSVVKKIAFKVNLPSSWQQRKAKESISRGRPYNTLYDAFSVYGGYYDLGDEDNMIMNYMNNAEAGEYMDGWQTYTTFSMPPDGKNMSFYAYYPYQYEEDIPQKYVYFNDDNDNFVGEPHFLFVIPDSVELQPDLMVASSQIRSDKVIEGDSVDFRFKHLLTAVRFTIDSSVPKGRIMKITINDAISGGTYYYGSDQFLPSDTLKSYSMITDIRTTGKTSIELDADQAFLMMPQYLAPTANVEIVYNNGRTYTLTKSLDGVHWESGKIVTYNIKITSLKELSLIATIEDWTIGDSFNWNSSF